MGLKFFIPVLWITSPNRLVRKSRENEAVNQDAILFPQLPNLPENLSFHLHKTRFYSLVKHYRVNGLSLCTHSNKKCLQKLCLKCCRYWTGSRVHHECRWRPSPFTPRTCSWLQKNWCQTAAKLHDKIYQGACAADDNESVGYSKLRFVDPTLSLHCDNETSDWSLLDTPEDQRPIKKQPIYRMLKR